MTIRTALAALALTLTPALAMAQCQEYGMSKPHTTASTCAADAVWSETEGRCVAKPSS